MVATLFVLLLRRLIGNGVDSVAASDTVKPAITSVWDIISAGLRQRALFVLAIGVAFIGGGLLAGPGRHEVAVRRFLAPYLRDHPVGGVLGRRRALPALAFVHTRASTTSGRSW